MTHQDLLAITDQMTFEHKGLAKQHDLISRHVCCVNLLYTPVVCVCAPFLSCHVTLCAYSFLISVWLCR